MAQRYSVQIFLDSDMDEEGVTGWFREALARAVVSPVADYGTAEISTRLYKAPTAPDHNEPVVRLAEVAKGLVRPATGSESYRVQIPGLAEGTTVPVYDLSVDRDELNRRLAEGIAQARRGETLDLGDFVLDAVEDGGEVERPNGWGGPVLMLEDETQTYRDNIVRGNN